MQFKPVLYANDSVWRYSYCDSGGGSCPVGYCTPVVTCPVCRGTGRERDLYGARSDQPCGRCFGNRVVTVGEACRHDTLDDACRHHAQYLLDNVVIDLRKIDRRACSVCGGPAEISVSLPEAITLWACHEHFNREALTQVLLLTLPIGYSTKSA
jgi:hypothetical protein